ncbi:hypothetical protein [Streptomyces sp. NBC_00878]|uniref:hypothetical protein n=1 Tax=Streptomyces sp. NBC_00878 TaxID=2975854 RepID=UPI002251774A|nr:hypothetical protein [Streptomyces sp. NBC_00878]MCX4903337.1 hypothetical protein [Streptomyces sp. NBC_00878]
MRTTRALAVSAVAFAAVGLAAPTAAAWDNPSNIVVMPSVIARGGQVTVTVDGCPNGGTMTSTAFPQANLSPVNNSNTQMSKGTATINSSATPGSYDITVNCSGKTLTKPQAFTVIGGVRGGLGGSSSIGATPADMAIGGGLVGLALIGSGVFWMRRRSESKI